LSLKLANHIRQQENLARLKLPHRAKRT